MKQANLKFLMLTFVMVGLLLSACGTPAVTPEPDQAPVEAPLTEDEALIEEPVIVEEPAEVEEAPDPEPDVAYAVYPGAEFVNANSWGPQATVYRYITEDSLDDVMAFYQAQYPYLIFEVGEGRRTGAPDQDDDAWMETGVINVWINHADEDYLRGMENDPSGLMPEDVLAEIPANVTLIELIGR